MSKKKDDEEYKEENNEVEEEEDNIIDEKDEEYKEEKKGTSKKEEGEENKKKRKIKSTSKDTTPKKRAKKEVDIEKLLKAYEKEDLINIISKLIDKNKDLEKDVRELLPKPSMDLQKKQLEKLSKSIMSAFPHSRFGSNRNHFCFKRVQQHVSNFKTQLNSPIKGYKDSKQFEVLMEYLLVAIPIVDDLPNFDDEKDNNLKNGMIKVMITNFNNSMKNIKDFDIKKHKDMIEKLSGFKELKDMIK
jgi:hypothetical protein